jgi:hypothetical protein
MRERQEIKKADQHPTCNRHTTTHNKVNGKVVLPFISQVALLRFGQHFKLLEFFLQDHRLSGQRFQSRFVSRLFSDEAVTQMLG